MSDDVLDGIEELKNLTFDGKPVKLKSPGFSGMKHFLTVSKDMYSGPQKDKDGRAYTMHEKMTEKSHDAIIKLIELSLANTFDDYNTRKEEYGVWALENNMMLMNEVLMLCAPKSLRANKENVIDKIKDLQTK